MCVHVRRRPGPWAGLLGRESEAGIWVRAVCQEEKPRETVGAGQRPRGCGPGMARVLGASCRALRGSEVCPGLARAGGSRWTPADPRDLHVCAHGPCASPVARRPFMVRSVGRGRSLAQVHSLPTCRLPTAHSRPELGRGCCDFQRKRKALERPQLAPRLLLLPPPVCWPLAAQGSGLDLGAGELAVHARGAWVTAKHPRPLSGAPNSLWRSGRRLDRVPAGPPARGAWSHQGHLAALAGPDAHCMWGEPLGPGCRARQRGPGCCHLCLHRPPLPKLGPQQFGHQGYGLETHPVPKGSARFRDCDAELCLGCASGGHCWAPAGGRCGSCLAVTWAPRFEIISAGSALDPRKGPQALGIFLG